MDSSATATAKLLFAHGPAPDRADKMSLYGWLVGAWTIHALMYTPDGATHEREGDIAFTWALEGRAILDVWTLPDFFHGTTLRIYDPAIDAWHIVWSDPLRQFYNRQIGRKQGRDIVQIGQSADGADTRWCFTEITPDSFHWTGERSIDGQANWHLQAEFQCQRRA